MFGGLPNRVTEKPCAQLAVYTNVSSDWLSHGNIDFFCFFTMLRYLMNRTYPIVTDLDKIGKPTLVFGPLSTIILSLRPTSFSVLFHRNHPRIDASLARLENGKLG